MTSSTFKTFHSSYSGSFMYSVATTLVLVTSSCTVECYTTAYTYSTDLSGKIDIATPTYTIGGAFYINSAVSVTATSNTYANCYLCD